VFYAIGCTWGVLATHGVDLRLLAVCPAPVSLAEAPRIPRIRDGAVGEALRIQRLAARGGPGVRAVEGHAVAVVGPVAVGRVAAVGLRRGRGGVRIGLLRCGGHGGGEGSHQGLVGCCCDLRYG
jgi:hypothetical protein